jgi:CDP-diacylglycerol--serine O-phosphatidyltransferase
MPIPAGAGVVAAVVHCFRGSPIYNPWIAVVWLSLMLFTAFLMVSNWRFWSAKELTDGGKHPFQVFALIGLVGTLIAWKSELMLMVIALGYLVSGVFARLAYSWGRRRRHPVHTTLPPD